MSNATSNTNTGAHNGHWTAMATKSGTYEFATGGKYVDRNIDLVIPQAAETVSGSAISGTVNPVVAVGVGAKNTDGKYPFTGSQTISGTTSGTATATVNTAGFTDASTYTGTVTGTIGGTATVSGSMNAATLSATVDTIAGTAISTVTPGTKADGVYPITGSTTVTGKIHANVSASGYATSSENKSSNLSQSVSVSASLPAAAATVSMSATAASPTVAADTTNDNISVGTITTTKPGSGYYAAVKATAPKTTLSGTPVINTAGYLGAASEITATASTTAKTGSTYYLPITKATVTKGTTSVSGTTTKTATRGTFDISEGYISGTDGDLSAATFKNAATSGVTYVDISETSEAPILISEDYLYINQGYTDNLKISLARLVPDLEGYTMAGSGDLLSSKTLYDKDGKPVTGTIETKTNANMTVSGATVTAPAGYYATAQSKSVASGSVNSYSINETAQADVIATAGTKSGDYYPISIASLTGTVNRTAGYISGTTSTAADSNGGVVGKIAASSVSGSDNTATATASANTTHNLAEGTYVTTATTGYTYHMDATASASAPKTQATKTVTAGYNGSDTTATATVNAASSGNKESHVYIKDGAITNNTSGGTSTATINSGKQIKIGKGYYPNDLYYTAQVASTAISKTAITGTLSTSITSGYTAPSLVDTATSGTPYVTITGNGTATKDYIYNGTATAKTQYMEVYAGSYSIT